MVQMKLDFAVASGAHCLKRLHLGKAVLIPRIEKAVRGLAPIGISVPVRDPRVLFEPGGMPPVRDIGGGSPDLRLIVVHHAHYNVDWAVSPVCLGGLAALLCVAGGVSQRPDRNFNIECSRHGYALFDTALLSVTLDRYFSTLSCAIPGLKISNAYFRLQLIESKA